MAGALGSTDKVDLYLRPALEPWRETKRKAGDFLETSFASPRVVKKGKGKRKEGKRKVLEVELGRWRYTIELVGHASQKKTHALHRIQHTLPRSNRS